MKKKRDDLFEGKFLATSKGFGFVRIDENDDEKDIFIPERYCKNAMHGDDVKVHIVKDRKKGRGYHSEGIIEKITKRNTTNLVGTFKKYKNSAFVIPDAEKITTDIFIPRGCAHNAKENDKVVVWLTDFGGKNRKPEGYVSQVLGAVGDPGVDVLSVIKSFDLPYEFDESIKEYVKENIPSKVSKSMIGNREDFRKLLTVTIDGADARDLDDAITLQKSKDGFFELGVHIADVAEYVTEKSILDKEALKRGTSVYFPDRVIPMLPKELSNGICSLNAGEDRLTLSCIMEIDNRGNIFAHRIVEGIINVNERMTYSDVNDLVTKDDKKLKKRYKKCLKMFSEMHELSLILRKKKEDDGSIDFNFSESKIIVDDKGKPVDIVPHERNEATRMIEEFMLAANKTVAEEYFWLEIPFLYRVHESPDTEKIKELASLVSYFGYHIKAGKDKVHPREIRRLMSQIEGTNEEGFLSRIVLRSMKRAKYSTSADGHFGLAMDYYSHFTSPIRRYPDLQIHRIIKENLSGRLDWQRIDHYEQLLTSVAIKTSSSEQRAEEAEREIVKLKKTEYMSEHIMEEFEGVISGITSWGIFVELPNSVEGMIRLNDMPNDRYEFRKESYEVVGKRTGIKYRMGQPLKVVCTRVDILSRTIDFMLAEDEE